MKKLLLILSFVCLVFISCGNTENSHTAAEKQQSSSKQQESPKQNFQIQKTDLDYESYSGSYGEEKLLKQDYKYGTSLKIKIDNEGSAEGTITSADLNAVHEAKVNFKGIFTGDILTVLFDNDGFGHSGSIQIKLGSNCLNMTTAYSSSKDNSALWGIGEASYKMINVNAPIKRTLQDLKDGGLQVIENETFNTKLDNYGSVKFISGIKKEDSSEIFVFYLADLKDNILYKFKAFEGNEQGFAEQVNCVAFRDFNNDKLKDILIICTYKNPEGEYVKHAEIYIQSGTKFIQDEELSKAVNDSKCNDTMENVISFLNE